MPLNDEEEIMSEEKIYMEEYVPAELALNTALGEFKVACEKLGFDFEDRLQDEIGNFLED